MDWQPIETAPDDGSEVMLWSKAGLPYFGRLISSQGYWVTRPGAWTLNHPTHWQPLPQPPVSGEKSK